MGTQDSVYYEGYGLRPRSLRKQWVNCCGGPDRDAIDVDRMEDELVVEDRILPSPFCGNLSQRRHRRIYRAIKTLRQYPGRPPQGSLPGEEAILAQLGEPAAVKRWPVASSEKTLREQTPPPPAGGSE